MSDDAILRQVAAALQKAEENPVMLPCPRCEGKGYHHGFGENGWDPDWCTECGGTQYIPDPLHPARAVIAALTDSDYLRKAAEAI